MGRILFLFIFLFFLLPSKGHAFDITVECIKRIREGSNYVVKIEHISLSSDKTKIICRVFDKEKTYTFDLGGYIGGYSEDDLPYENPSIFQYIRERIEEFVRHRYKPYQDAHGLIKPTAEKYVYSPDKTKLAFIIVCDDGHVILDSSLYVTDSEGKNITRIDTISELCQDIIWISENELIYVKAGTLWKATIK